ncbi:MAG TPA: hypothetical protein VEI97_20040 [bacterium]|nr:hypothetical protein [bacterium]
MRYLLLLVLVFGAYFAALHFIGDKYVEQGDPNVPPPPSEAQVMIMEGKIPMSAIKRTPEDPSTPPTVSVVEY